MEETRPVWPADCTESWFFKVRSKRQKQPGQVQFPSTSAEHVADSREGTYSFEIQVTHNMIDMRIQELQKMLDAGEEDVAGCSTEATSASSERTWTVRQALSSERWRKARPQLVEAMLEAGKIPKGLCQQCKVEDAVISCTDCLPKQMFCSKCDIAVHQQYSLHNRCMVVKDCHQTLPPTDVVTEDASGEPSLCEEVRLLPFALPRKICSCHPEMLSVGAGQKIIFININGHMKTSKSAVLV